MNISTYNVQLVHYNSNEFYLCQSYPMKAYPKEKKKLYIISKRKTEKEGEIHYNLPTKRIKRK